MEAIEAFSKAMSDQQHVLPLRYLSALALCGTEPDKGKSSTNGGFFF